MSPALAESTPARVGPHGGSLKVAGDLQLETVVDQGGIQMFACDRQGSPVSVDRGRGAAILRVEGNAKRYRYDLLPDGKGSLLAPVNLSQIAGRQIEIDVQLVGVGSSGVRFNEVATVPASETARAASLVQWGGRLLERRIQISQPPRMYPTDSAPETIAMDKRSPYSRP
jgi:hypothetical protein